MFSQRNDPDADLGYKMEMVSAVFPEPPDPALDYCREKKAEPGVHYLICKLTEERRDA